MSLPAAALLAALLGAPARAQEAWGVGAATAAATSPVPSVSTAPALGTPLPANGGPWIPAEFLFFSGGRIVSDYAWRPALRGGAGRLYTAQDLDADTQALFALGAFLSVRPGVYAIPGTQVPSEFAAVSASTSMARVVFDVDIKPAPPEPPKPAATAPAVAVSGVVLTPTAYRGAGRHAGPGLALDVNAAYYIGRLYGRNSFANAPRKVNYIDRVGVWTLTADGKMQVQSEGRLRPAVAVGAQASLLFRDSPQPTVQTPAVSVKVDAKSTKTLASGYAVVSKSFAGARTSVGVLQGTTGDLAAQLSEFLTPEALRFYAGRPGQSVRSRTLPFVSSFYLLKPDYPVGFEVIKFNGAPLDPVLFNFKIGRLFKLNFDLGLLKYRGGYDLLGLFQFRYNHFPKN